MLANLQKQIKIRVWSFIIIKYCILRPFFSGSPKSIEVVDPGQILVTGEGLTKGTKGVEAYFYVNKQGLDGEISVVIEGKK